jgi:putative transposase
MKYIMIFHANLNYAYLPEHKYEFVIRKYTKTKTVFPDDQSAMKAVYLAFNNIQQKWTMPIRSWGIIINQFIIKFEDRCQI